MRAIVLDDQPSSGLRPSRPEAGEVVVRVLQAGVCETDLQLIKGYMGFRGVLGHEFVGVAESGPFKGRRVVGEINCACQTCDTCKAGLQTHCPNRTVLGILNHDGAFADRIAVPQVNLHAVPDSISTDVAVFTEPVAAYRFRRSCRSRAATASSCSATGASAICVRRSWPDSRTT
jgi:threonine dehydrogenase-like Zn-dependent dehydrogenase